MRRVVAAAVALLAMPLTRPSCGGEVEPARLHDGSAPPAAEFDRHVASLYSHHPDHFRLSIIRLVSP
jgi:hypothetical protein